MDQHAPVQTLAQRLRELPVGETRWFSNETDPKASVKTTLFRLKKEAESGGWSFDYTVRSENNGVRVWRLA